MKVRVTRNDIEIGVPSDIDQCPVARALNRAGNDTYQVGGSRIYGKWAVYDLPPEVWAFVSRLDCGLPVDPIEFELGAPVEG
jgi:hypothetical protein